MLHSDTNGDNLEEGRTIPYQPLPSQPQTVPQGDLYSGWTDPNQYVTSGDQGHTGENYGPSAFPIQENMGQHPAQAMLSSQPSSSAPSNPHSGSGQMQAGQLAMWGPPVPPNTPTSTSASGSRGWRAGAILGLTLVLLLVFGVGLFSGWVFTRGTGNASGSGSSSPLQTNVSSNVTVPAVSSDGSNLDVVREAVINKVEPAVVEITATTSAGDVLGSGVIIDKRGYIVTNDHVINGGQNIQVVLADNSKYTAQVTGTDATDDLAVIKINPPATLVTATLGDSSHLHVGQAVLAIGNPLGITQTVTSGIISALGRNVSEDQGSGGTGAILPGTIQTDAPINPGNSGGALVDLQGNVIGIPTLGAIDPEFHQTANGVGFAIPSNRVNFIVTQLIQDGKVSHSGRAAMGITAQTVTSTVAQMKQLAVSSGVLIGSVSDGSPAQHAGLQANDVIVQIDNKQIDSLSALQDALLSKNPGDSISVKVYRGNQQLTVTVTLTELQVQSN